MKSKPAYCHYFFAFALTLFIPSLYGDASAADCAKAKLFYNRGVKFLNYEERRAAFQKAVDLCSSYAEAYCNLADAYENIGMFKKKFDEKSLTQCNTLLDTAVKHYKRAIELSPALYQARLGLAELYSGRGQYALAEEQYKKVLDLQPGNETAKEGLRQVREDMAKEPAPGLRQAKAIIEEAKKSCTDSADRIMGIEDHTVRDRQSFDNILFVGHSARIQAGEPRRQVDEIAAALNSGELRDFKFVIEGHTNSAPTPRGNPWLSEQRAKAIKEYLVAHGVRPERLITQYFGDTRLKYEDNPKDSRNRRVEILFIQQSSSR